MKYLASLVVVILSCCPIVAFSQVIPVEPLTRGFFGAQQTMTMLHEQNDAELIVVVVMGYPGSFGLRAGDQLVKNTTARMMRDLTNRSEIKASVVILDSPFLLQGIGARSSSDHLDRIQSVVKHYRERYKVPVWLFGHSDGSISVAEYLNRSEETRKSLAGAILSAGRDETRIREDWKAPVLVLHHESDGCDVTTFNGAKRYFSLIKEVNSGSTEFSAVVGGTRSGAPCSTGFHMYEGAFGEALEIVANFIARHK